MKLTLVLVMSLVMLVLFVVMPMVGRAYDDIGTKLDHVELPAQP